MEAQGTYESQPIMTGANYGCRLQLSRRSARIDQKNRKKGSEVRLRKPNVNETYAFLMQKESVVLFGTFIRDFLIA